MADFRVDQASNALPPNITRLIGLDEAGNAYPVDVGHLLQHWTGDIDPHNYGAKGDYFETKDGSLDSSGKLTCPGYTFSGADVGKIITSDLFPSGWRTITAVDTTANKATISGAAMGATTDRFVAFGTDDTNALQAALDAAGIASNGAEVGRGNTADGQRLAFGRTVRLRARAYLVRIPSSRAYALKMRRRTGLRGVSSGLSRIVCGGSSSPGWTIMNEGALDTALDSNTTLLSAFDDFISIRNVGIWAGFRQNDGTNGVLMRFGFDGYGYTDNWATMQDVHIRGFKGYGLYLKARGEQMFHQIRCIGNKVNAYIAVVDSTFTDFNSGGAGTVGIHIDGAPNCRFTNCKSFYSGTNGGTTPELSCNWLIEADQKKNGLTRFVNCEGQEARGSDWLIKNSGLNDFVGCISGDPGRANGKSIGAGTVPTVRAGFELKGSGCSENSFTGCRTGPSVGIWDDTNWFGTDGVYIHSDALGNLGEIRTHAAIDYASGYGPVGGPGWTAAKNPGLRVNGLAPS